jgi:hypothetical protein
VNVKFLFKSVEWLSSVSLSKFSLYSVKAARHNLVPVVEFKKWLNNYKQSVDDHRLLRTNWLRPQPS